jgi:hypothetical protein
LKTKNLLYFIIFFSSIQSCGNKNSQSPSKEEPENPLIIEQKPEVEDPDFQIFEERPPEKFDNIEMKNLAFGKNIFNSNCILNSKGFKHCDFNKLKLNEYSIQKKNEFDFIVSYEFKNCDFNYLSATFYSSKNFHRVTSGSNEAKLTGYSISIKDPYISDTKTNEYNLSCQFVIKDIQASLSEFSINKINGIIHYKLEKQKAFEILNELSSYPNYNKQQYSKYKNILDK